MKRINPAIAIAVATALSAPFWLAISNPTFAKQDFVCEVLATHPTIQSAVDDATCDVVMLPAQTFVENVVITRDVTIRGKGAAKTVVAAPDGSTFPVFAILGQLSVPRTATLERMAITGGGFSVGGHPNGGGIHAGPSVTLNVNECWIHGNKATQYGGGISMFSGILRISSSTIENNQAHDGGGVRITNLAGHPANELTIENSVIRNNKALRWAGGILAVGGALPIPGGLPALVTLTDSIVEGNVAEGGSAGGMYIDNVRVVSMNGTTFGQNVPDDIATRQMP